MCWGYVYEEEHFNVYGHYSVGAFSDGKNFLFFTVSRDEPDGGGVCRVYSSISFCEDSLECQYDWCAENDAILFECLDNIDDGNFCGDGSPVRTIRFQREKQAESFDNE